METLEQVKQIIKDSNNIVFFGGAGMSTESGIPDFRSADGLYNQKYEYPPEEIISHSFFMANPEVFYRFYREKIIAPMLAAEPNKGHLKLAQWEREGKLKAVVTQNIDNLHQRAGSKVVYELHGGNEKNYCIKCGHIVDFEYLRAGDGICLCPKCSGIIHPGIVLYEEGLDDYTVTKSVEAIQNADVMIVAGTSLRVYPAAGLINYYKGDKLILINRDVSVANRRINYILQGNAGEILSRL
ncbi:MAG: NAD-dependent protein deacylase [Abditibacteriota bacterium]|nr:NAD-dependent protein deacylase [Abditibacteriota bacterium]